MKKVILIALFLYSSFITRACLPSNPADYFRTVQNGDWGLVSTWESSADNATWFPATLVPDFTANAISILAHTITVTSSQSMDQVILYPGAVIEHNGGTLTVNDGPGDDIIVLGGSAFQLNINPGPAFAGAATMRMMAAGTLVLSASGLTGAGTGVNAANYVYGHQSVLEYTLPLAFSSSGVTYFPNVSADTIPTFRTTSNIGIVGAIANTTFNGVFEANGNITFANSGHKIFRNGIDGTGNIDGTGSGKFIINGTTAILGGSGILTVPFAAGMDIGNGTNCNVYMASAKTVNNNIALLANSWINLLGSNLTMNGAISGGNINAHVVTNGLGTLVMNNVTAAPAFFPVGASAVAYNPVSVFNGGGLNYGVRVENGINPPINVPVNAVNRTWFITPNGGAPGTINCVFNYAAGDANAGFNYAASLELGQYTSAWNVIQTGLVPAGSYQVTSSISTLAEDLEAPLVLANLGAILAVNPPLSVDYLTGLKQNDVHILKWKLTCNSSPFVDVFLERRDNSNFYTPVFSTHATAQRCNQPFLFTDVQPAAGINYYRLKLVDATGKISYSNTVYLVHVINNMEVKLVPSLITNGSLNLQVNSGSDQQAECLVTDMQGKTILVRSCSLMAGFNSVPLNIKQLAAGTYLLCVNMAGRERKTIRFAVQ